MQYNQCPQCAKKGVYLKTQPGEDGYICRYCQWSVYLSPETEEERKELAAFSMSIRMSRYQNLLEAYDAGFREGYRVRLEAERSAI